MKSQALSIRKFNLMAKGKQITYLWERCVYIVTRVEQNYSVHLYGCTNFYAEVWYKHGNHRILKIASFQSVEFLEPYLNRVDISDCL